MRTGSTNRNGSAAFTSEARKRNHYAHSGQVSFDECSYKLATLAVESFGRLGKEGSDLIDQAAASIVGGTDASSLAQQGVSKERVFQIISVTTPVAISRMVHRYRLSLRDRQAAKGREEEAGGLRQLAWGGNVDEDEGILSAKIYIYIGKRNGEMVGGRYHCFMVRPFDFIGTTAALWKDIRFTSERHLRYIVGGQKI